MFQSESDLSFAFKKILPTTHWANTEVFEEVEGLLGIPDFILIKKNRKTNVAIGVELKLSNWQRAMNQAFKYKTFCNMSYVIMDDAHIEPAKKKLPDFIRYNIGLASIDDNKHEIKYFYKPIMQEPYSEELNTKLYQKLFASIY